MRPILLNLFRALSQSYAMSVLLLLGAWVVVGAGKWAVFDFFFTFMPVLLLPSLVLLPLGVITRSWWGVGLLLPIVAVLLITYGAQFLPRTPSTPITPSFTVLSVNLLANGRDYRASLDIIRASNADIVAIQEFNADFARQLQADTQLMTRYRHQATHPQPSGVQGQGVLSRFPIVRDEFVQFTDLPTYLGHQFAQLNTPFGTLHVVNAHPSHPGMTGRFFDPTTRAQDIARLLALTNALPADAPILLLGDFNLPEWSAEYARITTDGYTASTQGAFTDAYRVVGWGMGMTYPNYGIQPTIPPFLRLDYVFYRGAIRPLTMQVGASSGGSDHYPLQVTFAWHQ